MAHRDKEIAEIGREIILLREAFSMRLHNLEQRLQSLDEKPSTITPTEQFSSVTRPQPEITTQQSPTIQASIVQPLPQENRQYSVSALHATPSAPSENTLIPLIREGLAALLTPFSKAVSPLVNWYQHYQEKGQGPIFIFMLVGITLLVCGFAYLAQLLVGELGAGSKSLLLFLVSLCVTFAGHRLATQKTFEDLGSATISLGLLLNFVTIYMAGSYYQLLADWLVLLAYIAIGLTGFILANRHSAKIVSALSIVGGATIPLIFLLDGSGTTLYLCGLGLLAIGSFYQASTKSWLWLSFVTVTVCSACLEYLMLFGNTGQILGLFSQLFYCLYFAVIWQLLRLTVHLSKTHIIFISLTLFSCIGLLYQTDFTFIWALPLLALTNALISLGARFKATNMPDMIKSMYAMISSVWLLVAIFSSLAADYWGMAVSLEGLFLLFFALKSSDKHLRIEAYGLVSFGILHALLVIAPYFPSPAVLSIKGLLVSFSIGGLLFASRKLLQRYPLTLADTQSNWEYKLTHSLRPLESLWLTVLVTATAWVYLANWFFVVLIPLQLFLLWKSKRHQCQASEMLVFLVALIIGFVVLLAALEVQSLSLSDLPAYAQTALIFLFVELWALCEFYRRFSKTNKMAQFAETLRLSAYILSPILFIPSVAKHNSEFLSLALWLSSVIAYALARLVQHRLLRTESLFLSLVAACYCVTSALINPSIFNLTVNLSLVIGLVLFGISLQWARHRHVPMLERKIASIGLYFYAAVLFEIIIGVTNIYLAGATTSAFVFILLRVQDTHPSIKRNLSSLQTLIYLSMPLSWICLALSSSTYLVSASVWLGTNLVILLNQLIADKNKTELQLTLLVNPQKRYIGHHLFVCFSLLFLLEEWHLSLLMAPWLIIQGSYLFFAKKQSPEMTKFALGLVFCGLLKLGFIDAANALLWQKVVLLIGIGLFMVAAAFAYQRRINKNV
jgi:hypothetical protein